MASDEAGRPEELLETLERPGGGASGDEIAAALERAGEASTPEDERLRLDRATVRALAALADPETVTGRLPLAGLAGLADRCEPLVGHAGLQQQSVLDGHPRHPPDRRGEPELFIGVGMARH